MMPTTIPDETVDAFSYECQKQSRLKEQLESEGFTCIDDPANLYDKIGTVQEIECYCQLYTPRLLLKLYAKGCILQMSNLIFDRISKVDCFHRTCE